MFQPIFLEKYYIYDIFHNDDNKLVIIMPGKCQIPDISYKTNNFNLYKCGHKNSNIYVCSIQTNYEKYIELKINNEIVNTKVNKYPEFKNEIIFSTLVLNEDIYIKQWIYFHSRLGIDRFIIYDNYNSNYHSNAELTNLELVLHDYIEEGKVILIKWDYLYDNNAQPTQQNHSLYAFQNSKYIGFFDVDEYLNIQNYNLLSNELCKNNNIINHLFENLIKHFNIDVNKIGSFKICNKFFFNPDNLPENDFNFLKIFSCSTVFLNQREKHFVLPKNICTFCVHQITSGKKSYSNIHKSIYFNHYLFLNKKNRGRDKSHKFLNHKNYLIDKSILKYFKLISNDLNI